MDAQINMQIFKGEEIMVDKAVIPMRGYFFFSKTQRKQLMDKRKYNKLFCKLDDGQIREYTEMLEITESMLDPMNLPYYQDAVYLGTGEYFGRSAREY
jgi:hypothetical protein